MAMLYFSAGILILLAVLLIVFADFHMVHEGTYKAVMRFGAFRRGVMVWKKHHLNDEGGVVDGDTFKPFGGLFVTIRFVEKIHKYSFRRAGVKLADGKIIIEDKKEEVIDYIFVRPDTYPILIKGAETMAVSPDGGTPERIAVDGDFLVTIKVTNPRMALFEAPPNWLENVLARLTTLIIRWWASKTLDQLISLRGAGASERKSVLWDELCMDDMVTSLKKWGITIIDNGIDLGNVTPPPEIQKAAAAQRQQELEAKGRMAGTAGLVLDIMATARGLSVKQIQEMIVKDKELEKEFMKQSMDLAVREMGIDGRAYLDIRTPNGSSLEGLIALYKNLPLGNLGGGPSGGGPSGGEKATKKSRGKVKIGGRWYNSDGIEAEEDEE